MTGLNEAQIAQFREEGYVLLPDLYAPGDLLPLIQELEEAVDRRAAALKSAGQLDETYPEETFATRPARICRELGKGDDLLAAFEGKAHKTPGMFAAMTHPALLDAVEALVGPEILAHPQFNLRAKLPDEAVYVVPWHQDLAYLEPEADATPMVNFWVPLVDAPMESGALQVIPGSHKWGLVPHEEVAFWYIGLPDEKLPPHIVVDCPVPLGGALVIQHKLMHRSVANTSGKVRWSIDIRYSDPAYPTGRPNVPGFLARSRAHPDKVARSVADWLALFASVKGR